MAQERGLSVAGAASTRGSATLNGKATVKSINQQTIESRDKFVAELDARLDTSREVQAEIMKSVREFKGKAKAKASASIDETKKREKALKRSLKTFVKAKADGMSTARAQLASDYEAYAKAVSQMETSVNAGAKTQAAAQAKTGK